MQNDNLDDFLTSCSPEETEGYLDFIEKEAIIMENSEKIYSLNEIEELFEDIKHQIKNHENETSYGEPQAFVYLEDERTIEITKEQEGLSEEDYFYSIRLRCSEEEFNNNDYHSTNGIIESLAVDLEENELKYYIGLILSVSKKYSNRRLNKNVL